MSDPIRDCPHGHMKGKCDTCDLIVAEERITKLEEQLKVTRKYSYGDGYEGASIEFAGLVQERDNRIAELEAQVYQGKALLKRYRDDVPLGHQPHMIAHIVDSYLKEKGNE